VLSNLFYKLCWIIVEIMSEPDANDKLAGHPPAVKVAGGVRITQNKVVHREEEPKPVPKEGEEPEEEAPAPPPDDRRVLISGVLTKGDKDFPPEAIKAFHEKPMPSREPYHGMSPRAQQHVIQQPRKNWELEESLEWREWEKMYAAPIRLSQ